MLPGNLPSALNQPAGERLEQLQLSVMCRDGRCPNLPDRAERRTIGVFFGERELVDPVPEAAKSLKKAITESLRSLQDLSAEQLLERRQERWVNYGKFKELAE